MNKRIKLLALQAGFHTDEPTKNFGNYQEDKEYFIADDFIHVELEKFAELIVQECAEVLDTWNKENGVEEGHDKQGLISLWSSHFGVEE